MPVKNYSCVAKIYSHLMRSIDYKMWANYIYDLSRLNKKRNISLLELACGSGNIACLLSKKIKDYTLCDLSLDMLLSIEDKFSKRINCDITLLPFKKKFDFIFSTFDSVNYLLTKKTFVKMLNSVEICLSENGIYTFDVSLEANSINNHKYLNRKSEYREIKYEQISKYNSEKQIHSNTFRITDKSGNKYVEKHKQRIYYFSEYFEMISKTNLYVYGCYDAFSFNNASSSSERAQFVLKKRRINAYI
ncbi:MAG: class I SAM-dependent methyltransferase [Bacteroidota bacterium]